MGEEPQRFNREHELKGQKKLTESKSKKKLPVYECMS